MHGDALVLMAFDETKQIFPKYLENHAYMDSIGAFVQKMVEERYDMGPAGMCVGGRWRRVGI
jgi:hypothetical protein